MLTVFCFPPIAQRKGDTGAHFRGPSHFYIETYKKAGLRGLYKGGFATVLRETPSYGVYFAAYEFLCHAMTPAHKTKNDLSWAQLLLAGGMSGIFGWLSIYPIDVIKTRLQDGWAKLSFFFSFFFTPTYANPPSPLFVVTDKSKYQYKGIIDCARRSYQEEGMSVFFRGLNATIVRAFPTNAVTLLVYTLCMRMLTGNSQVGEAIYQKEL